MKYRLFFNLTILSALLYFFLNYILERNAFITLFSMYTLLFGLYLVLVQFLKANKKFFWWGIAAAISFRFLLLFSEPNWSDDFYRFFWDGKLSLNGISPFSFLPSTLIENGEAIKIGLNKELFEALNSPEYYSVYPPVLQAFFYISALLGGSISSSVFILKLIVFACECGTITLMLNLLNRFNIGRHNVFWYALNPLIIIELVGNLHFEAALIFFLLRAFLFFEKKQIWYSAGSMGLAFAAKLIPLIFLPYLIRRIGWMKSFLYGLVVIVVFLVMMLPFFDLEMLRNMGQSVELYYQKFEFNASIYFIGRWIGYQYSGWNMIAIVGKLMAIFTFIGIVFLAFKENRKNTLSWINMSLWAMFIYLLFANIVHPWYLTTLVALSVFSKNKFAIVWSYLVMLSYHVYASSDYIELEWIVAVEYACLFGYMIWSSLKNRESKLETIA